MVGLPGISSYFDATDISDFARPVIEQFLTQGECIIFNPQDSLVSGSLSAGPSGRSTINFPIYYGGTRIQPRRTALEARGLVNDATTRRVSFWIDFPQDEEIPDIRPGYQVVCTDGGNDQYLKEYQYIVQGAINSSMAWQRTIETVSDLERSPLYEYSYISGTMNVASAMMSVEYLDSDLVWQPYYSGRAVSGSGFRFPVMGQTDYRLTFSDGTLTAVVTVSPTMGTDSDIGQVVLS